MAKQIGTNAQVDYEELSKFFALIHELGKYSMADIAAILGRTKQAGSHLARKYKVQIIKK
jgi:hypothetical protein